ncbi:MAG: paraquat-inducible protein A [Cardiobacteriaceae bacterium]|nr:paraquat-inducible protein A [Cardiobacteriaceae bacterium]
MKTITASDTAKAHHLTLCLDCSTVVDASLTRCPHCHSHLHQRKPKSYTRTWAYLFTSIVLFFPANLLPITTTSYLTQAPQSDTIMSSIALLWHHGSYSIAAIIFFASIFTPFFKIAVLLYLLTHKPSTPPVLQTRLYKLIHFVGRWSMIDVFVVALLGALVHGRLAQINPAPGIFAFAAVVVFTMLATESFDMRLIWDNYRGNYTCKNPK